MSCSSSTSAAHTFSTIMNNVESIVSDRWKYRGSELGGDDPELLRKIIYLLVTPLQATMNARLLLAQTDISGGTAEISFESLWFDSYVPITVEGESVHDIAVAYGEDLPEINLPTSRILPWPWNQGRLHGTLASCHLHLKLRYHSLVCDIHSLSCDKMKRPSPNFKGLGRFSFSLRKSQILTSFFICRCAKRTFLSVVNLVPQRPGRQSHMRRPHGR